MTDVLDPSEALADETSLVAPIAISISTSEPIEDLRHVFTVALLGNTGLALALSTAIGYLHDKNFEDSQNLFTFAASITCFAGIIYEWWTINHNEQNDLSDPTSD